MNTHTIHKNGKNTEKMSSKADWLYFFINTQQFFSFKIGWFGQYFLPLSIVLVVYSASTAQKMKFFH